MPARTAAVFPTVRSEGGLLPPDLLQRIVQQDRELGGFDPIDYGLSGGDRLSEAISHEWRRVQNYWAAFQSAIEGLPAGESGVTETREQWLMPLLRSLGYHPEFQREAETIGNRRYLVQHREGPLPLHLVSFRQDLDHAAASGQRRISPHAELQELLNVSDAYLYGLASNGHTLRLLRDSHSLTRLTYLEFDLKGMLEGSVYADFVLLWLALHRTRLPRTAETAAGCWLERWRNKAEAQGARAMGALRGGVEEALKILGTGLLSHPANAALRERLRSGELTTQAFYAQLLRLLYRVLFLFVAEERGLLFKADAAEADVSRYLRWYSLTRLRDLGIRYRTDDRHDDLWQSVQTVFSVLGGAQAGLGLPELGGLFSSESCPDIDGAKLSNAALTSAVAFLSSVKVEKRWRRVNYRDIDAEELGGVYEALLERQPDVCAEEGNAHFDFVKSGQRKQTGSYYTPSDLVDELIKSALDPVIADRLKEARGPAEQERALLGITVCDSATGSGHFLVAAARRISRELARVKAGDREPSPAERREALRQVIRHCIYGVDANPLAVDLCRMSLWLEGHDAGLPLTFLDHRIKVGNSLVGATPELLEEGIPDGAFDPITGDDKKVASGFKKINRQEAAGQTRWQPDSAGWQNLIHGFGQQSLAIAELPEDEAGQVRDLRNRYQQFEANEVEPARSALDAWTAAFFWPLISDAPEPPTTDALRVSAGQPPALSLVQQREMIRLRDQLRFFHWPLEFPEVFDRGGFDCVLGNPPWERIKLQELEFFAERDTEIAEAPNKAARQRLIERLSIINPELHAAFRDALRAAEGQSKFVRASERFPLTAVGDVNVYALFAEHDRCLVNSGGRAGVVVPTGIATDDSTKHFFQDVTAHGNLGTLFDFENREDIFRGVGHGRYKFSLLTLCSTALPSGNLAFFLTNTGQLTDERRRFQLTPEDFALLNPNTRTCPIFRTAADAELTRAIYRRVPVLIDETSGASPWGVQFLRMFDMSNDSGLFRDQPGPTRLPLYEAKLLHQFTHRWGSYADRAAGSQDSELPRIDPARLADPFFTIEPRYWIEREEVEARLEGRTTRQWLVAFRDIARAPDERTAIFAVIPRVGAGNKSPLIFPQADPRRAAMLVGSLCSLVLDYAARQKVAGTTMNFFLVKQFPVLPPTAYTEADLDFVVPRVLELTYTAWDLQPFARDLGFDGEPFRWDPDRRALLRAELDAYYAALYGLTRDELRYILDPTDVYGPDFPGETFRVLKEREEKEYGEYRTRRLVLEAWDRLDLAPRNRDGRYEVPPTPIAPPKRLRSNGNGHAKPPADVLPTSGRPSQQPLFLSPLEAFASEQSDEDIRRRALDRALTHLHAGPLTARELAGLINDPAIDRHTLNSVLFNEGREHVDYDEHTHTYRLKQSSIESR